MKRLMTHIQWYGLILMLVACSVNPAERNNTGNNLSQNGDYEQALQAYQAALVAEPDNALFYFNAAQALASSGQGAEAIAALEQALNRGEDELRADAYYNLGNLYLANGQYDEAITAYQESLRLRPEDDDARHNLEVAIFYRGQPTPTAIEMQTRPDNAPADPNATPTPNPAGQDQPSPTPPPQMPDGPTPEEGGEEGDQIDEQEGTPLPQRSDSTLTSEEAMDLLEPIIHEEAGIGGMPDMAVTPGTPVSGKDW